MGINDEMGEIDNGQNPHRHRETRSGAAMNSVPIVIVGLRFGSQIVEDLLRQPSADVRVVGVCDLDGGKARTVARRFGLAHYPDLDAVLADDKVQALGLFTPPAGRAELIRKAIRADKHVMTTKPFEMNPVSARDVLQEADRRGNVVHLNSPSPTLGEDLQTIDTWRRRYGLGQPVAARAATWAGYREDADGSWYDDPARCPAPPLTRLGIYLINDIISIFGPVESVHVTESRLFTGRPTADNAMLTASFVDGACASVFASFCIDDAQPYQDNLDIHFEGGTITRRTTKTVAGRTTALRLTGRVSGEVVNDSAVVADRSGAYQWDVFHRAITEAGFEVSTPIDHVVHGVAVLEAISHACRSRKTATVNSYDGESRCSA